MRLLEPFARYKAANYLMTKSDLRQETSRTADLGWDTHLITQMTLAEANQHAKLQLDPSSRFCTGIR